MSAMSSTIRSALPEDAAEIARVHVESWRTTYKGIIRDEILTGLSVEKRAQFWLKQIETLEQDGFIYVAEQDKAVIGFSSGGPERSRDALYKGEIYGLYLLKEYQQQGFGRRLVEASVISLMTNGINNMLIWVLRDNPSRKFYEALGGTYVREKDTDIRGQILIEVAYGWDDLNKLVKNHA